MKELEDAVSALITKRSRGVSSKSSPLELSTHISPKCTDDVHWCCVSDVFQVFKLGQGIHILIQDSHCKLTCSGADAEGL